MRTLVAAGLGASLAVAACGGRPVVEPTPPSRSSLVVLLPDRETGSVGQADVRTGAGSVVLQDGRRAVRVVPDRPPMPIDRLDGTELEERFGGVLAALPPPPVHFTLDFEFESDRLTAESRGLVPRIVDLVQVDSVAHVSVVGHTDSVGTQQQNFQLGLARANRIRTMLLTMGVEPHLISVQSHGEHSLLVPTPDETEEARNRRVEVVVR